MRQGNTHVESLIIVGVVLFVIAGSWLMVNPFERISMHRDDARREDVRHIYEAIQGYKLTHAGVFPVSIDMVGGSYQMIGTAADGCDRSCPALTTVSSCVNLASDLSEFLEEIPKDPQMGSSERTGYAVNQTAGGDLVVVACNSETTQTISVGAN